MTSRALDRLFEEKTGAALETLRGYVRRGDDVRERFFAGHAQEIVRLAKALAAYLENGGKILLRGNGGSAADAQHLAGRNS